MVVVLGFGMYYSAIVEWEHYESDCSTFTLEEIKKLTDSGKLKIENKEIH
jgi:hypothetical protein